MLAVFLKWVVPALCGAVSAAIVIIIAGAAYLIFGPVSFFDLWDE